MNEKHIGRSVRRLEDSRFLVGRGRYVADIAGTTDLRGHVEHTTFISEIAGVDLCVNLRDPTMGETSAVVIQAMQLGTPVIVTDAGHADVARRAAGDARVVPRRVENPWRNRSSYAASSDSGSCTS